MCPKAFLCEVAARSNESRQQRELAERQLDQLDGRGHRVFDDDHCVPQIHHAPRNLQRCVDHVRPQRRHAGGTRNQGACEDGYINVIHATSNVHAEQGASRMRICASDDVDDVCVLDG